MADVYETVDQLNEKLRWYRPSTDCTYQIIVDHGLLVLQKVMDEDKSVTNVTDRLTTKEMTLFLYGVNCGLGMTI